MNALCTAPSRAVRNPTTRGESCGFVDESYGPARALRAVWTARGQRGRVAHRLPTLSRLSPTSSTGPTTGDSQTTTPHNPSPRLPPPTVQDNICLPLKPIPTSPTAWLTPNPSGSFPYGISRRGRVAAGAIGQARAALSGGRRDDAARDERRRPMRVRGDDARPVCRDLVFAAGPRGPLRGRGPTRLSPHQGPRGSPRRRLSVDATE